MRIGKNLYFKEIKLALQICPKCKNLSFNWFIDDNTPLTQWNCECGYYALEDESKMRDCPNCGMEKRYAFMSDEHNKYWWCFKCGKKERIE